MKKILSTDHLMWDSWMSIYHFATLTVADELNLFSELNKNSMSIKNLSENMQISKRAVEVLANVLCGLGFIIEKHQKLLLSSLSRTYLLSDSPYYWGAILENARKREEHQKILQAIKTETNQLFFEKKTFTEMWKVGEMTHEAAVYFTKRMHASILAPSVQAVESGLFQTTNVLLDVGAGSGCFSIAFIKKYPTAKAILFELPAVCEVAKEYINQHGVGNRIILQPGNFFIRDNWPKGHDGILLSQIMHDWRIDQCRTILNNAYESLPKNGKIFIHEMLLDECRQSPLTTACFDLLMFINHHSQQFTKIEIFNLLREIGFRMPKFKQTFGYYSIIEATK